MSPIQYVNAMEAARIIGVSDRTIREWVKNTTLSAHHPAKNRLAIPIHEVEAIARERRQYQVNVPDASELAARVSELEQQVRELQQQVRELATRPTAVPSSTPLATPERAVARVSSSSQAKKRGAPERELPPGCILASEFAKRHGVNRLTFRDHLTKGIRGERVEAEERPKPGREHLGETERYLTPEQQQQALDFWERYGVPFQESEPE